MFKLLREGSWWLSSEKDPRWNCNGRERVGGFMRPNGADEALEKLKEKYGEPPDDLEWGYMKD